MLGPPLSSHMNDDRFRPRLPLNPFPESLREPWTINYDLLPSSSVGQGAVLLIIGEPTRRDVQPLFESRTLASSLLIFASHAPPAVPSLTHPTIRVLRLTSRIAVEETGAARLVNVLEWAERVARVWRRSPTTGARYQEFNEEEENGIALVPPSKGRFGHSRSTPSSPQSSQHELPLPSPTSSQGSLTGRPKSIVMPPTDPTQRPFDAILNFMPEKLLDKSLLKQAILVTTISRPFLVAVPISNSRKMQRGSRQRLGSDSDTQGKRKSIFRLSSAFSNDTTRSSPSRFGSALSVSTASPVASSASSMISSIFLGQPDNGNARLIHLLPSSERHDARLIRSIEAFLLSFSFSGFEAPGTLTPARPYLLYASTFGETLRMTDPSGDEDEPPAVWSVAQLLLSGAMEADDPAPPPFSEPRTISAKGKGREEEQRWITQRAWLGGARDIVVTRDGIPGSVLSTVEKETGMPPIRSSRTDPGDLSHSLQTTPIAPHFGVFSNGSLPYASPKIPPVPPLPADNPSRQNTLKSSRRSSMLVEQQQVTPPTSPQKKPVSHPPELFVPKSRASFLLKVRSKSDAKVNSSPKDGAPIISNYPYHPNQKTTNDARSAPVSVPSQVTPMSSTLPTPPDSDSSAENEYYANLRTTLRVSEELRRRTISASSPPSSFVDPSQSPRSLRHDRLSGAGPASPTSPTGGFDVVSRRQSTFNKSLPPKPTNATAPASPAGRVAPSSPTTPTVKKKKSYPSWKFWKGS